MISFSFSRVNVMDTYILRWYSLNLNKKRQEILNGSFSAEKKIIEHLMGCFCTSKNI